MSLFGGNAFSGQGALGPSSTFQNSSSMFGSSNKDKQPETTTTSAPAFGGTGTGSSLFATTNNNPGIGFGNMASTTQGTGAAQFGLYSGVNPAKADGSSNAKPTVTSTLYNQASALGLGPDVLAALGHIDPSRQSVSGAKVDIINIRPTTRFSDLNPEIQKQIIAIHEGITTQINTSIACASVVVDKQDAGNDASRLPFDLKALPKDVEFVSDKLKGVQQTLQRDTITVVGLKNMVGSTESDLLCVKHAIESIKLPATMKMSGLWNQYFTASRSIHNDKRFGRGSSPKPSTDPVAEALDEHKAGTSKDIIAIFKQRAIDVEEELETIKRLLSDVENHILAVEHRAGMEMERLAKSQHAAFSLNGAGAITGESNSAIPPQIQELMDTMRLFENAILKVAGRISELREKLNHLMAST